MRKLYCAFIVVLLIFLGSFKTQQSKSIGLLYQPAGFPPISYDTSGNPLSAAKIALGKKLFYDPVLSRTNTISCASCHKQEFAFSDGGNKLSKGIDEKTGSRNTPSLANLAWSRHFFWDGSVEGLELQPVVPMTNHVEMDETMDHILMKVNTDSSYKSLFKAAFGIDDITFPALSKALAQFLITCISADSRYDQVMQKKSVHFTKAEKAGYELFKTHCSNCHTEPLFTNHSFANNEIGSGIHKDEGRYAITLNYADKSLFKVPSLRNVSLTAPYMHDGRFGTLDEVLYHYQMNIEKINLPNIIKQKDENGISPFNENGKQQIIAFLKTLTDSTFIHNPDLH